MYCLIKFCCICFNKKDPLQHLFDTDIDNITYFIKLTSCIPEMSFNEMNDRRLICKTCCENIEIVYKFRQKCLESKTMLKDYISQLHQVSNIRGEVNVYLMDLNKYDNIEKEYQNDTIKTKLLKDIDNDINEKVHSETKSELSVIDLKLTDNRLDYIKFETVVVKMESENQNSEQYIEKIISDPLGNRGEINIDISHNDTELAASEIKKEGKNEDVDKYLQENFNILQTCDSENVDIEKNLKKNSGYSINSENCSEDVLINPDEIKIDIVHNDIELMDREINNQCKIEDTEECSIEDLASPLKDQNVHNAHEDEIFFHKTSEEKPSNIAPSTSKVQDIDSRKIETIRKKLHECSICHKKFTHGASVTAHMGIHSGEKPHSCSICMKKFRRANFLKNHMRIHTEEKPYECDICKKKFRRPSCLTYHMLIHTGEMPYECTVCKKKFRQSNELFRHTLVHTGTKQYGCNICGKKFRESRNLSTHMLVHTGEKPYECTVCKKKFRHSSSLFRHALVHTGEKPYECDICRKKFRESCNLYSHMLVHTGEKPYECNVCKNKFRHSSNLSKHMLVHTEDMPFECNICEKKFKRSKCLSKHMLTHTDKIPHECNICKKKFVRSKNLFNHMLVHTENI